MRQSIRRVRDAWKLMEDSLADLAAEVDQDFRPARDSARRGPAESDHGIEDRSPPADAVLARRGRLFPLAGAQLTEQPLRRYSVAAGFRSWPAGYQRSSFGFRAAVYSASTSGRGVSSSRVPF